MIVYRLCKSAYAGDRSGKGAELAGGRWNSKGVAVLYTGNSRALCTTEIAVHTPLGIVPKDYQLVTIDIPDDLPVQELPEKDLPQDWKSYPHPNSTQLIGDAFVKEGKCAALKVPSVAVQGEFNYVLNPAHPDFARIKIVDTEPFGFDERLFVK